MTEGSPWFRATDPPEEHERPYEPAHAPYDPGLTPYVPEPAPYAQPYAQAYADPYADPYAQQAGAYPAQEQYVPGADPYGAAQGPYTPGAGQYAPVPEQYEPAPGGYHPQPGPQDPISEPYDASAGVYDEPGSADGDARTPREDDPEADPGDDPEPEPEPQTRGPGRAERRRAAKGRGGGRGAPTAPTGPTGPTGAAEAGRPLSRVEARRAARARKDSVGVVASRVVGELFITLGVVMLLFVTYQLWWTNVRAGLQTDQAKHQIEDEWAKGRTPGAFEPGQGFAIMHIPKLDVVVPIAEGISKSQVLDRGMVGHYGEGRLKTAMPADKQGNFAVAGHRNTHGEPFRYINQLKPGDPIVVETQDAYYTYTMTSILPQTSPSNISVITPVPPGSGFTGPGRYITLTTCTPEFTSTYRMIVWGKMVEERPRSKGKPDALVG